MNLSPKAEKTKPLGETDIDAKGLLGSSLRFHFETRVMTTASV